jgi:choline/glycine/proline betaine transport protein
MATVSVVAGLDAGIRRLSELNMVLALVLLSFVLLAGPTVSLLGGFIQNFGNYLSNVGFLTFNLYAYEPNEWLGDWTLFYWAWWISWSPFVGMFIARISRGRTIREFILGVLFIPAGFTFLWFSVFGNSALFIELSAQGGEIVSAVTTHMPTALFVFLERLPFTTLASLLATLLIVTFFVTSSDSGSLVIDIITSGGNEDPPIWQRVFWAIAEGVVASVLLLAGGLSALQTAAISSALPFSVVMLFICYGLYKALKGEDQRQP